MPKTYAPQDIATDTLMQVRFLVGDNVEDKMIMDDAEIEWLISEYANVYMAAAAVCDSIAMKISTTETASGKSGPILRKRVGQTDISYASGSGRTAEEFKALGRMLRARGSNYQMPYAGGISIADKHAREDDTDRPRDGFKRGMFDDPSGLTRGSDFWGD
jgi:hypothetical protein